MSTTRRLCVTLTILGLLAAATLWTNSAGAQQRIIGRMGMESPPDEQTMEGLSIPKDREATAIIAAATDYIKKSDWDTVARSLQYLLERPEDSFFEVTRKDENGKEYTTRVSIRIEANRMISQLPPEGLETYRQKYGQRAMVMLQEAKDKNDPMIFSKVALKYRHTAAGIEAIGILGNYFLDRGNYQLASGKLQEFLELIEKEKPEVKKQIGPKTLYKAALAHQRFGDKAMADKFWKQVVELIGDKGLQFSPKDKVYTIAELKAELEKNAVVGANTLSSWPVLRGDAARTAVGIGGIPFMESRWSVDMFRPNAALAAEPDNQSWMKTAEWVQEKIRAATDMIQKSTSPKRAMLPGFFPVAGNNRLIFRTYDGIYAFFIRDEPNLGHKAGELDWASSMVEGALHKMGSDQNGGHRGTTETWWSNYSTANMGAPMPGILFENSAVGTLSHDNKFVYCVDDLAIPPHPGMMSGYYGNGSPFGQFSENVMFNSLIAIEMETGRLKWEIGERKAGSKIQFPNPNFNGIRQIRGADGKVKMVQVQPDGTEVEIDPMTGKPIKKPEEPIKPFVPKSEFGPTKPFVNAADELQDCFFLGAPLSVGGRLYVLVEYNGELQLCCLNPDRIEGTKTAQKQKTGPELVWRQPLGTANLKLMQDSLRRIQPCHLAYNDGILICPTNAGAIIAVNLLNQSLSWAYLYRTGKDPNAVDPNGPQGMQFRRGGRFGEMGVNVNMGAERWYPAPPAIVNGNVVFTAPDSNDVVCLSLRDGKRIWSQKRQANDLYMAGVYNDKVLIVAKDTVRALKLSDGNLAWDRPKPVGMPSGQGVASKGKYYLPCKNGVDSPEPQIVEIDIDTGATHATKSRKKEIPGNLIFYDGEVISQSIWQVSAYPQLHVKLAEMNARLTKNPNDPVGLTDRGELHLDKGELVAAVTDLKKALEFKPDPDTRSRARHKLYDTLSEMLQKDFNKGEEHLDLYKDLCLNEVAGEELIRRQSAYLTILGKGREAQGKLTEAFDAYMKFGQLNGAKEMVPSVDEPGTMARPDVWAHGRIVAMIAKAKPEDRKPLEDRVAKQWQEVKATGDLEKTRAFVKLFGTMFGSGKEAMLVLAERLTASASPDDQRQGEAHLDTLRRQTEDRTMAALATEAFAKFLVQKKMLRDALHIYRTLGTEFKDVKLRDGRTGADVFNELITDKRFLPYLETSAPVWSTAKMKGERLDGPFNQMFNAYFNVDVDGDPMPFFQQHRLEIHTNTNSGNGQWEARLVDRATRDVKFRAPNLPPNSFINQNFGGPGMAMPTGSGRIAQARGHLLMLTMSNMVYVWDMLALDKGTNPKPIISINLLGEGISPQQQGSHVEDGTHWVLYSDGSRLRIGQGGILESSYVCVATRNGLEARDPGTGAVMWKRDTGAAALLFGDSQYIFAVEAGTDGSPTRTTAVRAADGVSVKVPDFSQLFQASRRVGIVGRNLLVFDDDPKGGKALRLYDVLTGKDVWRQNYPVGSKVIRSQDPGIAGVVEANGKLTVVAADSGKTLMKATDPDERIQKNAVDDHLTDVQELVLLQDRENFYVVLNKSPDNNGSYPFVTNGLKALRIHGTIYSYAKGTGTLNFWRPDMANEYMVLENFDDLPIIIFGSMMTNRNQAQGRVEAITKKGGSLFFNQPIPSNGQFHAMTVDPKKGEIELQRYDLKIKFSYETKGGGVGGAGKDEKPADKPTANKAEPQTLPKIP